MKKLLFFILTSFDYFFGNYTPYSYQSHRSFDRMLKAFLLLFKTDIPPKKETIPTSQHEHNKKIIQAGGWTCACGRANPAYTSTCVCGRNKQAILKQANSWFCSCGRENQHYVSTCVCGVNKRDATTKNDRQ